MSGQTSETPWLNSADNDQSRWQEFVDDTVSYLRNSAGVILGFAATIFAIIVANYASVMVKGAVMAAFLATIIWVCGWASRSARGLPTFVRGMLRAIAAIQLLVLGILLYGMLIGYDPEPTSGDELYQQPTIEMIQPVAQENIA